MVLAFEPVRDAEMSFHINIKLDQNTHSSAQYFTVLEYYFCLLSLIMRQYFLFPVF